MGEYIVSARKYRPMTFDSVVGQAALTATLKNAVKRQIGARLPVLRTARSRQDDVCTHLREGNQLHEPYY